MGQGEFDWTEPGEVPDGPQAEKSLDEKFIDFLEECPDVYPMFVGLARRLKDAGHERGGAKQLVEVIRYNYATRGKDTAGFKINNSFTSRLSRKMVEEFPEFADFFEFRTLRT